MRDANLDARLNAAARQMGVALDDGQRDRMLRFVDLLDHWTATYNVSGIRGAGPILQRHVIDCLALVPSLTRWSNGHPLSVLDVGSGAGLPGLIVAIARPDWTVTTIDAVFKKVAFVRQAIGELGLANANALHGRVELLAPGSGFNVIVSRAYSNLEDFTASTRSHLASDGVWVAMKGTSPDQEIEALQSGRSMFHVEPLHVPGLEADRCLVWIRAN
jgi:16S rRNA (guanine527-N7)-methyltransferase